MGYAGRGTPGWGGGRKKPDFPEFQAPKWQTSRVSALSQQFAAPQIGRLKRQMTGVMGGMGYDPQSVQARRSAIRGYGEGLGGIMAGAGERALGQYGQEYGAQFEAKKIEYAREEREQERRRAYGRGGLARGGGGLAQAGAGTATTPGSGGGMFIKTQTGSSWLTRKEYEKWEKTNFAPAYGQGKQLRESVFDIRQRAESELGIGVPALKKGKRTREGTIGWEGTMIPGRGMQYRPPEERALLGRQEGGPVHGSVQAPVYEVGDGGTPSNPEPELYVPDHGQPQLVGTQGPEARTFPQEGEIIPAPETDEIMNKQMQISYDPLPPLSGEEQAIFDAAIGEEGFEATPENMEGDRENMLIQRQEGGEVQPVSKRQKGLGYFGELQRPNGGISTELSVGVNIDNQEMEIPSLVPTLTKKEINYLLGGSKPTQEIINKAVKHAQKRIAAGQNPFAQIGESIIKRKRGGRVQQRRHTEQQSLQQKMMNYLTATRFSPSGAGHMPMWQFMLQAQPQKLAGLLGYLQGRKPGFGSGRVYTGPARKKSTRRGFVPERRSGVTTSPSGRGTAGRGPTY